MGDEMSSEGSRKGGAEKKNPAKKFSVWQRLLLQWGKRQKKRSKKGGTLKKTVEGNQRTEKNEKG